MMRFETQNDLDRERRAIKKFVSLFGGSYKKLGDNDVDFRVYDKDGNTIAYAEVKGRNKSIADAYPLPISTRKVVKLFMKGVEPVVIWACFDGLLYAKLRDPKLVATEARMGGRFQSRRKNAPNDIEHMLYYPKQKSIKYVMYHDASSS